MYLRISASARDHTMEISLSSLLSSQEFPALANLCDVLLNCLPLAPLIRLQAALLQRHKRYLWGEVVPLPKAELFFPVLRFDSALYAQPCDHFMEGCPGCAAPQCLRAGQDSASVRRTAEPWPSLLLEEDRCKGILT